MDGNQDIDNFNKPEYIFNRYYQALCYFAFQYLQDDKVSEDIVQDVFTSLIEKPRIFSTPGHIKNFLYQSVKNACLNFLKKEKSQDRYRDFLKNNQEIENDYELKMIGTEVFRELKQAIDSLPEECRKVYELNYFSGLDNNAIAEELGISVNTVKAQKSRGKKILKEQLKDLYPILLLLWEVYNN